jgi:prepilin-type N-terminal cleavage/methylation domain-containing protein
MGKNKKGQINYNKGFTLMEMLVVIGIIAMFAVMSLFLDINNYRGDAFRSEQSVIGMALQTARADALNNINQKRHGVAIHPGGYDGYVIFEGDTYNPADPKNENIKSSYNVTFTPASPSEIVFRQLSGDALDVSGNSYDGDITLVDSQRNMTAVISINHEGKISW